MKQRTYVITSGGYEDYKIVAHVTGNERPALSTLRKQFDAESQYAVLPADDFVTMIANMKANVKSRMTAEQHWRDKGYAGYTLAEHFVEWLIKEHGFVETKLQEMWV